MYNRYLQNSCPPQECKKPCPPPKPEQPCESKHDDRHWDSCDWDDREHSHPCQDFPDHKREKDSSGLFSILGNLFGGKEGGGLSKLLDDNTLLILLILYFLLKDENGIDHDLLLIAGIFLLLGL